MRSRFTKEQMVMMLRDADRRPVTAMVKQLVSSQTIYGWRVTARAAPAWKAGHGDTRSRGRPPPRREAAPAGRP